MPQYLIICQQGGHKLWRKKHPMLNLGQLEHGNSVIREKAKIGSYKRTARLFINKHSNLDDLEELKNLIVLREEELKK